MTEYRIYIEFIDYTALNNQLDNNVGMKDLVGMKLLLIWL